jgi:hypothetical protein
MARSAAALTIALLLSLPACAGGPRGPYESCLREPSAYRNGLSRQGATSPQSGFWWQDWGGGGIPPNDPVMRVTLTKNDCLYSIHAEGPLGRWTQGGFTYLDEMTFHQDRSGRRLGFVGFDEAGVYAVIDGDRGPAYKDILWRPSFSPSGQRSGYLAKTEAGAVAVVDGQIVARAPDFHRSLFEVLDDGRFAAAPKRGDGQYEVILGNVTSPPVADLCDRRPAVILPSGRFAFVGKHGDVYTTYVDGREVAAPGIPANCEIVFSDDETRFGWIAIHTGAGGVASTETGAIIDGAYHPLGEQGADVRFRAGLAIIHTNKADPSGYSIHGNRKWEHVHWLVDLATPAAPPTQDDYFPVDNGWTVEWSRVQIGQSVGPRFDKIDWLSLFVDDRGKVHYTGDRRGSKIEVIDNVIIAPNQGQSTPVNRAPDTPSPGQSTPVNRVPETPVPGPPVVPDRRR